MLGISLAFARSSLCLVLFSSAGRDGPARAVDGEACTPHVDDACTPVDSPLPDMVLSAIKSIRTSVAVASSAVSSSDIHARDGYLGFSK
jgi:hypothetical protein